MWVNYFDEAGNFEGEISYALDPPQDGELITINERQYYYDAILVRFKQVSKQQQEKLNIKDKTKRHAT